ncbi:DNA primase [Streptomyces sp. NPDC015171]|uniref:DNA primase n=1 Tax=Streptomyces sp. NPDC015171 TaxID=3364945 RepID=UPI0036F8EF95
MNRTAMGLAIGAGYLLGRTKKLKMALAIGSLVAGKKLNLSPKMIADVVNQQLKNNPQFKEIQDQLRQDLRGVGKAASGAMVERQMNALADRLHSRTAQVRDEVSGAGDEKDDEDAYEDSAEQEEDGGREDEGGQEDDGGRQDEGGRKRGGDREDRRGRDGRASRGDEPRRTGRPAERTAGKKSAPAKKAAAGKTAPAKKAAAKKTGTARKTAAKKTAATGGATRNAAVRQSKGGDDR